MGDYDPRLRLRLRFQVGKRGGSGVVGVSSLGQKSLSIGSCLLSEKAVEVRELEEDHLVIAYQLARDSSSVVSSHALIDNGATGFAFMEEDFARHHQFPLIPLKKPRTLEVTEGRPIASGMITHLIRAKLQIRYHMEDAFLYVTRFGHYPLILRIPWLRHHDVNIRFILNRLTFDSEQCCTHHNAHGHPTWIKGLDFIPKRPAPRNRMAFIGCAALLHLHRKKKLDIHLVSLQEVNALLNLASLGSKLKLAASKETCKDTKDPRLPVLKHFHWFLHVFEKGKAQELPLHRIYDHSIPLKPDSAPRFSPLYGMSHKELLVLKEYIEENLAKGFI